MLITVLFFVLSKKLFATKDTDDVGSDSESDSDRLSRSFLYDFYQTSVWRKFTTLCSHHDLYVSFLRHLPLASAKNEELIHLRDFCEDIRFVSKHLILLGLAAILVALPILILKFIDAGQ